MNETAYEVPADETSARITEKKSRFIAHLVRVSSEEEAAAFIRDKKKEYWDARHNCSAFVIGAGHEITRCSDDGEPSGTAGRPMLDVLLASGLHDTAAVVTRYFGGVLLGTGGLVRAYSSVLQLACDAAPRMTVQYGCPARITAGYTELGKIENLLHGLQLAAEETVYTENVTIRLMVPSHLVNRLKKDLTECTNARAQLYLGDAQWYEHKKL